MSRIEMFGNLKIRPKLRHYHPFGCPAYVLNSSTIINKWEAKARVGIYLGISPKHARSVYLILNPTTGIVSPQYHVKFDSLFQTIKDIKISINWKEKCHFQKAKLTKSTTNAAESNVSTPVTTTNNNQLPRETSDEIPPSTDEIIEELETTNPVLETGTRSGRVVRPTSRYIESQQQKDAVIVSYHTLIEDPG